MTTRSLGASKRMKKSLRTAAAVKSRVRRRRFRTSIIRSTSEPKKDLEPAL